MKGTSHTSIPTVHVFMKLYLRERGAEREREREREGEGGREGGGREGEREREREREGREGEGGGGRAHNGQHTIIIILLHVNCLDVLFFSFRMARPPYITPSGAVISENLQSSSEFCSGLSPKRLLNSSLTCQQM